MKLDTQKQCSFEYFRVHEIEGTLNREPIEENFDDLEDSSGKGGKRPETKEQLEAERRF